MRTTTKETEARISEAAGQDPLKTLLLFHRSIRASLEAFDALVHAAEQGRVDEYKASALYDFFVGPMRWHDRDERESILEPLAHAEPSFARLANEAIDEHTALEAIVDRVVAHLSAIAQRREWPNTSLLRAAASELRAVVEPHLEREERELFPAARKLLSTSGLAQIEREISARAAAREIERARTGIEREGSLRRPLR